MENTQTSFFEDGVSTREQTANLILRGNGRRPLTKSQKTFNRLVRRVESLRSTIEDQVRQLDEALAYYGRHLHARLLQETEVRKEFVRTLAPFLEDRRLKWKDRDALRQMLGEHLDRIIGHEGPLNDDDLRVLFQNLHRISFDQAMRENMEASRSMMEDMFDDLGLDIDLSNFQPDMTPEAFAAATAELDEKIRLQAEQEAEAEAARQRRRARGPAQLEKERRMREAEELRKRSIAAVYKQLAKVLHPDLEPDAAQRERKLVLMQELTAAYRNNDLHTLLRLELEWIRREEGNLERLTQEKLSIYNQVLREQALDLEHELESLPYLPRYRPLVVIDGPFQMRLRTDGPNEAREIDASIATMNAAIFQLRSDNAIRHLRNIVREYRRMDDFTCPF